MNSATIVQKLWNYCNVLRDDGMSYGDYVEQLTYLLFLKMADERSQPPWSQPSPLPKGFDWPSMLAKDGDDLFDHYRHLLDELGREKGTIGLIFAKAQNKFQDPAKLRRLVVDLIDCENWSAMGADVKGDAYEGLLEKNAQDTKSGAGQYFTPRPLIQAMVDCIAPKPGETVCDPACGTGGFLFAAHNHVADHHPNLTREQKRHLKEKALRGWELVQSTARLAAMNMMLHGIGSDKAVPIVVADALAADPGERFDVALYNPANRHDRRATWAADADASKRTGPHGRWRAYDYAELIARDKASLDIFWLKDDALADSDHLPPPHLIAQEIVDDLEAALEQFRLIAGDLGADAPDAMVTP